MEILRDPHACPLRNATVLPNKLLLCYVERDNTVHRNFALSGCDLATYDWRLIGSPPPDAPVITDLQVCKVYIFTGSHTLDDIWWLILSPMRPGP